MDAETKEDLLFMEVGTSTRRQFLRQASALIPVAAVGCRLEQSALQTRLILLGTGGGPRPRADRLAASQVIIVNDVAYVIDCGDGVANQLARANVPLPSIRGIFITHHHSDHNADYGNLFFLAWASGLTNRIDTWGPPPLELMTRQFLDMNAYDINIRVVDEGRSALAPLIFPHEVTQSGEVMQDENITVTCAMVDHPPVTFAFAYRFTSSDRSIVISGDTKRSDALVELASGADVLVHEVFYQPAVDRLAARLPSAPRLRESIMSHHTSVEDAGRVAQAAGVRTLVLSHLVPPDDPSMSDEMLLQAARSTFGGHVLVGKDLMEI